MGLAASSIGHDKHLFLFTRYLSGVVGHFLGHYVASFDLVSDFSRSRFCSREHNYSSFAMVIAAAFFDAIPDKNLHRHSPFFGLPALRGTNEVKSLALICQSRPNLVAGSLLEVMSACTRRTDTRRCKAASWVERLDMGGFPLSDFTDGISERSIAFLAKSNLLSDLGDSTHESFAWATVLSNKVLLALLAGSAFHFRYLHRLMVKIYVLVNRLSTKIVHQNELFFEATNES